MWKRMIAITTLCFVLLFSQFSNTETTNAAPSFAKGADISWVVAMEAQGYKWKDKNGVQRDILQILKNDYQINSVRIRVWVNPSNNYENGYMTVDRAANLAKRAKDNGMSVMLTLHYSDFWADPGQQNKPAAWQNYNFQQLMDAVWNWTRYVMTTMQNKGVTPDWVQIGNETNNGMLWNDGKATNSMQNYAWLVNTGHNAVKSISNSTKTIVHLANAEDNALYHWNIGGIINNGANFDIIGMSLYPSTNNWQSMVNQAISNANNLINTYGKPIMITEIGMDVNQPSTSKNFITDIKNKVRNLSGGKGQGVFYWEPQSTPGYNNGYNKGAWSSDMKPTIALEGFIN